MEVPQGVPVAHGGRMVVQEELLGCPQDLNTLQSKTNLSTMDRPNLEDMNSVS